MKVFISWSGERSREIAEALKELLSFCLSPVTLFLSSVDQRPGTKWKQELDRELASTDAGVLCLTAENGRLGDNLHWVMFEAGAMSARRLLIPYLVGVRPEDVPGPLRDLQHVTDSTQTKQMVLALARELEPGVAEEIVGKRFEAIWGTIRARITGEAVLPANEAPVDPVRIYERRSPALREFWSHVEKEIEQSEGKLWIVGSSLRGFIEQGDVKFVETVARASRAGGSGKIDVRVILTEPSHCSYRELCEGAEPGEIAAQVERTIKELQKAGVPDHVIRLHPGTPTVSGIALSDWMLLNPYPYGKTARDTFSMIVHRPATGIYAQYLELHFEQGWLTARPLSSAGQGERIVALEWTGSEQHIDMRTAHATGQLHRAVHVEVRDNDAVLVWQRADGRFEIPGGHPRWLAEDHRKEDSRAAAARELVEELGPTVSDPRGAIDDLAPRLELVASTFNQSGNGRNNEWVDVYRIQGKDLPAPIAHAVEHATKLAASQPLSPEGNRGARWMKPTALLQIPALSLASSLKLFLARTFRQ